MDSRPARNHRPACGRTLRYLLLFGASVAAGGCAAAPPAVILSTDVGCEVDDQWALAYLLLLDADGAIDLRAVVTSHAPNLGEEPTVRAAEVARGVIDLHDPASEVLVLAGSSVPLRDPATYDDRRGARLIAAESRRCSPARRLKVLTIGAATDVARALELDPTVADRIEVIAMGFEDWPRGGDPWNVKNDPAAYETILASRVPLTIGAADTCVRHLSLDAEQAAQLTLGGRRLGARLRVDLGVWLRDQSAACRKWTGRDAWPIWDLITVAHLLGFTVWEERPRPRLRADLTFEHEDERGDVRRHDEGVPRLRWITALDEKRLWSDFRARLERQAQKRSSAPGPSPPAEESDDPAD